MGGLRGLTSVWAQNLPDSVKRRFYKNWHLAKQNNGGKAFTKYAKRWTLEAKDKKHVNRDIERIKNYCAVVRVFAATQIDKMRNFRQKKSHLMEISTVVTLLPRSSGLRTISRRISELALS